MRHFASRRFWAAYEGLSDPVRALADESFERLKRDPRYPSLHFKKIGELWSVRVGAHHRALGVDVPEGVLWIWIGTHAEYDRLIR